ncbi:hypothetical protein CD798_14340 [Bacillaceae bacterium SAOS 7]|nr:hypothetical protein CD798_14340 [Bacillaceae bacterium SAOS 7]
MKKVLRNRVRCKKCNDIIESKSNYDLTRCKCGAIFVDGGREYQRFGWGLDRSGEGVPLEEYIDFSYSLYEDD